MSSAADGKDGNGLQLEKSRLTFQVVPARLQIIDINDRGLFSHCKLRLCLPLDVQRKCPESGANKEEPPSPIQTL